MGLLDAPGLTPKQAAKLYERRMMFDATATFQNQGRGAAFAIGVDEVDNLGWFSTTSLFSSTNNQSLTTQASPANVTATSMAAVVRFGANIYLQAIDSTSGLSKIYRSIPPSAGTVSWTPVLSMAGTGTIGPMLSKSSWATGTNYLYAGDYGDPSGGPSLWRSADGTTWTKVLGPVAGLRHFHAVAADPYAPGVVYLTAGDGQGKVLAKSTDSGATWTWVITNDAVQSVQISFDQNWIWLAGDQGGSVSVWVVDRANPSVPMVASQNHHWQIAVPGGQPARGPYSDGVLTQNSTTFTSATANFTSKDVGRILRISSGSPISLTGGIYITGFTNSTTVTLNKAAGGGASGVFFYIDGETWGRAAFYGAVDPNTGIYYLNSNDTTSGGMRSGLFYLPYAGGRIELLEAYTEGTQGPIYFRSGKIWCHQGIHPLLNPV